MLFEAWHWIVVFGAAGGTVNAAVAGDLRLWPTFEKVSPQPPRRRLVRAGLAGHVLVSGIGTALAFWMLSGQCDAATPALNWPLLAITAIAIGAAIARWTTSELDRWLLRRAVWKAAEAPGADPATVRAMRTASPYALYRAADELMPQRMRSVDGG